MKFKNMFTVLAATIALLGITSCSDDNKSNPVLNDGVKPTTFVLNTPSMSEMYIELSPENTVTLSWSQPNYGFAALATYSIQVGVVKGEDDNITWCESLLQTKFTTCRADVNGEEIAMAINEANGFKSEDEYRDLGVQRIAMRVHSAILDGEGNDIEVTKIVSNTVIFAMMKSFKAIRAPKKLWLIGQCSGWKEPTKGNADALAEWVLDETEIGTNIYTGEFEIPAGEFALRFYTDLTGWDGGASIGGVATSGDNQDVSYEADFDGSVWEGAVTVPSKDNWRVKDWPGGTAAITVDLNKKTVRFEHK